MTEQATDRNSAETRQALMAYKLDTLIATVERSEARREAWQKETTATVEHVERDVADLKVAHRELREDVVDLRTDLQKQIDEMRKNVGSKVGVIYFKGFWSILVGIGAFVALLSGLLTLLQRAGVVH